MSTFYTRFAKTTLLLAATGGIAALALKVTALLLQALVLPTLLATALGVLTWLGYNLVLQLVESFQQPKGEPSVVVQPTVLAIEPEAQPDSKTEEAQQPHQVEMIEEPQPEIDLQPIEVYQQPTETEEEPEEVEQPEEEEPTEEAEPELEGEQQPDEPQPEPEATHHVGEEETFAPALVEESSVEPTLETSEAQPEDLEAVPVEGSDTGGTLEAEEILSEEEIKAKVEAGELTYTRMKQICRDLNLTGYGKIRNCAGYVTFLAQQNIRRSQLEQAA